MIKSPLKWVGGKAALAPAVIAKLSDGQRNYWEPFCGGFSVGLQYLQVATKRPPTVVATDANEHLINFWRQLRDNCRALTEDIRHIEMEVWTDPVETYTRSRKTINDFEDSPCSSREAALFYHINKCGFNGLWRVNKAGKVNVPMGTPKTHFADYDLLQAVSGLIQGVRFEVLPFWRAEKATNKGWDIYCDPPYIPISETSNFVGYTKDGFDHAKFAEITEKLAASNNVVISNSGGDLWPAWDLEEVSRRGTMNSVGSKRGAVKEVILRKNGYCCDVT